MQLNLDIFAVGVDLTMNLNGKKSEREVQGYQSQILVGDMHLIGTLRHAMNPIVAFTLEIWSALIRK